jgi:hypothetical protein
MLGAGEPKNVLTSPSDLATCADSAGGDNPRPAGRRPRIRPVFDAPQRLAIRLAEKALGAAAAGGMLPT